MQITVVILSLFNNSPPHEPPVQAIFSPIPTIQNGPFSSLIIFMY